ncbi:hypothetical protein ONS95_012981 [Cadophora gregata]|uniref:uncharacterized protein n=1 Tax=Cadophora gregata TaxID=51156 RepID=UPI0026DD29F7|nr:uncharacterized protein ONS95_012981 [Cadophora gregata]KAK0101032.1 hypothetical protein ONS96_006262 [Cadophora gregata f. sp. sojae]KAK0115939.1 hypothetical protein ONS95_012981 [Cadophora gregata]
MKELQAINRDHVHQALEAKHGAIITKPGKGRKIEEPKEWRAWSKMYPWERELAFDTLKKAKRAYERGEVQRQFENNRGEIISLIDDEPKDGAQSKSQKRAVSIIEDNSSNDDMLKPKVNREGNGEPKVKDEPIDINGPPAKKVKKVQNSAPADNCSDDEGLRKKRERMKKLAEEIDAEERLGRMKREHRALEAEIEAEEKPKKNSRQ